MSISVLGAGAFGTALATMLAGENDDVVLWGRDAATINGINLTRQNPAYLPDIILSEKLVATDNLEEACQADTILCVTPAQSFSTLADQIVPCVSPRASLVLCAKGIDRNSGELLHTLAETCFGKSRVAALSGPGFAADIANGLPTAVTLAADTLERAGVLAQQLSGPAFRIYASFDVIGVEAGGALKNVIALAVGAVRGLALGASAEAALIARGFAEMNRIAISIGAQPETLAGLSGLGDLVLSCSSPQSRNFAFGMAMARGENLSDRPLAEGVFTAEVALQIARNNGVDAPVTEAVVETLNGQITAAEAVEKLLSRSLRNEC